MQCTVLKTKDLILLLYWFYEAVDRSREEQLSNSTSRPSVDSSFNARRRSSRTSICDVRRRWRHHANVTGFKGEAAEAGNFPILITRDAIAFFFQFCCANCNSVLCSLFTWVATRSAGSLFLFLFFGLPTLQSAATTTNADECRERRRLASITGRQSIDADATVAATEPAVASSSAAAARAAGRHRSSSIVAVHRARCSASHALAPGRSTGLISIHPAADARRHKNALPAVVVCGLMTRPHAVVLRRRPSEVWRK